MSAGEGEEEEGEQGGEGGGKEECGGEPGGQPPRRHHSQEPLEDTSLLIVPSVENNNIYQIWTSNTCPHPQHQHGPTLTVAVKVAAQAIPSLRV